MNEFDPAQLGARIFTGGRPLPTDFSDDEVAFAQDLNAIFDVEREDLPPHFITSLLGRDLENPIADDFEERICAMTFAQIDHAHSLVLQSFGAAQEMRDSSTPIIVSKVEHPHKRGVQSLLTITVTMLAIICLMVVTSGTTLAHVITFFTGRGGVSFAHTRPTTVSITTSATAGDRHIKLDLQWAGETVDGYHFTGVDIYNSSTWSDGAVIELHYTDMSNSGDIRKVNRTVTILEFMPRARYALQVVGTNMATPISLGTVKGIFVAGYWSDPVQGAEWNSDHRSELICEGIGDTGTVVWIATGIHDPFGSDKGLALLSDFAQGLTAMNLPKIRAKDIPVRYPGIQFGGGTNDPFNDDIIQLLPNAPNVPSVYTRVGSIPGTDD